MNTIPINCLLYFSRASIPFTTDELDRLLVSARKFNSSENLRGILVYSSGYFIQFLEGPLGGLTEAMLRIRRDTRHQNVEVLMQTTSKTYLFPNWKMGLLNLADDKLSEKSSVDLFERLKSFKVSPNEQMENPHQKALEVLIAFREALPMNSKDSADVVEAISKKN